MPNGDQTLAQRIRAKYPDVYTDLSDTELERRVRAKYPGTYDHLPMTSEEPSGASRMDEALSLTGGLSGAAGVAGRLAEAGVPMTDLAAGAVKGVGQTVTNLARFAHQVPGVSTAVERLSGLEPGSSAAAFERADELLEPTSTAQRVGKGAEQVAEVLVPGRAITATGQRLAAAVAPGFRTAARGATEAASAAGIAAAQGGDPTTAAALGAVTPIPGAAIAKLAPRFQQRAQRQAVQALGPTKERFKALARKRAPEVLRRPEVIRAGARGGQEGVQALSESKVRALGKQIGDVFEQQGGKTTSVRPIVDALDAAKQEFQVMRTVPLGEAARSGMDLAKPGVTISGQTVSIPVALNESAVRQIDKLQETLQQLGPDVRVDHLRQARQVWDDIVAQAGGYAHRAPRGIGIPLKEGSEAKAMTRATKAIRQQLDEAVPEVSKLNKEYSFWKDLEGITRQTVQRTEPQGRGLRRLMTRGAAGTVGGLAGSGAGPAGTIGGALLAGELAERAHAVITSPNWRLVSAKLKDDLARAIASGAPQRVSTVLGRITATQGSKLAVPAPASR